MSSTILKYFICGAVIATSGCARPVSQEELIDAAVVLKIEQWKNTEHTRCRDKALTKAEAYVDSLLLVTSLDTKLDTIPKPVKPEKPEKPVFRERPDTVVVKPILQE